MFFGQSKKRAIAIVLVITILSVLVVIAVSFAQMAQLNRQIAATYSIKTQTRLAAFAGVDHALTALRAMRTDGTIDDAKAKWRCFDKIGTPVANLKKPSFYQGNYQKQSFSGQWKKKEKKSPLSLFYTLKVVDHSSRLDFTSLLKNRDLLHHFLFVMNSLGAYKQIGLDSADVLRWAKAMPKRGYKVIEDLQNRYKKNFAKIREFLTVNSSKNPTGFYQKVNIASPWNKDFFYYKPGRLVKMPRAAININTAPTEVLLAIALYTGYFVEDHKQGMYPNFTKDSSFAHKSFFHIKQANNFVNAILQARPFHSWQQFYQFLNRHFINPLSAQIVFAYSNPNTNLLEINPNASWASLGERSKSGKLLFRGASKLSVNKLSPSPKSAYNVTYHDLCLSPPGTFEIQSLARLFNGKEELSRHTIHLDVEVYNSITFTTQADFEGLSRSQFIAKGKAKKQDIDTYPEHKATWNKKWRPANYDGQLMLSTRVDRNKFSIFSGDENWAEFLLAHYKYIRSAIGWDYGIKKEHHFSLSIRKKLSSGWGPIKYQSHHAKQFQKKFIHFNRANKIFDLPTYFYLLPDFKKQVDAFLLEYKKYKNAKKTFSTSTIFSTKKLWPLRKNPRSVLKGFSFAPCSIPFQEDLSQCFFVLKNILNVKKTLPRLQFPSYVFPDGFYFAADGHLQYKPKPGANKSAFSTQMWLKPVYSASNVQTGKLILSNATHPKLLALRRAIRGLTRALSATEKRASLVKAQLLSAYRFGGKAKTKQVARNYKKLLKIKTVMAFRLKKMKKKLRKLQKEVKETSELEKMLTETGHSTRGASLLFQMNFRGKNSYSLACWQNYFPREEAGKIYAVLFSKQKKYRVHYKIVVDEIRLQRGLWYHLALSIDSRELKLYINGLEHSSKRLLQEPSFSGTLTNVFFGGNGPEKFPAAAYATVDDVHVYNKKLPTSEINQYYLKGRYEKSGNYTSPVIFLPSKKNVTWACAHWTGFAPGSRTKISVEVETNPNSQSAFTAKSQQGKLIKINQYGNSLRFKVALSSSKIADTPVFDDITFYYYPVTPKIINWREK